MAGTVSRGNMNLKVATLPREKKNRRISGGPFSLISPVTKSGLYYYRSPTSFLHIAAEEVGTPLTVKVLEREVNDMIRHGDILTLHKIFEVVKLECTKPDGDAIEIPIDIGGCIDSINVYNFVSYNTIGDVIANQKIDNINWIVVTKGFEHQGCSYNPGTIFEVLTDEEEDNEYLAVEMHPGRLMVFLPINIRGEFYKIDSPLETKQQKLVDLKWSDTPLVFTPALKTFPKQFVKNTGLCNELLIAKNKKVEKLVLASSYRDGEYFLHVFPLNVHVFCEILLGGVPVDMLKSYELDHIEKQLLSKLHHEMEYMLSISYKNAGIERLKLKRTKSKLKKKDIKLPLKQNDDDDYPKYVAKPTKLMKELGQNLSAGAPEPPTIVRMRTIVKRSKYPINNNQRSSSLSSEEDYLKDGDFTSVTAILKNTNLEKYEDLFVSEKIDCKLLSRYDENDFLELGLERDEVDRLCSSLNGGSLTTHL